MSARPLPDAVAANAMARSSLDERAADGRAGSVSADPHPAVERATEPRRAAVGLPPWDIRGVGAIALAAAVVLGLRAGRYGYFGDELYFLSAGRRLAAGYVDQGPLVPLMARTAEWLAPGSVVVLRIPAIACGIGAIWVCAGVAREFGGGRAAQRLAALGFATTPFLITASATLSTFAVDATLTAALAWILVRWNRIRDNRLLLAVAVVAAVDLQVKLLLPVLAVGIAIGVLIFGPRALFRRPVSWAALVVVGLSVVPGLCWQASHGWPQLAMASVIAQEQRAATGGVAGLPIQVALLLGMLGTLLAGSGVWALLRSSALRPYRFVAIAALVQVVFVVATDSRPYYAAGLFPVLLAAGAVWWTEGEPRRWWRGVRLTAGVSAGLALAVVLVLPLPQSALHDATDTQRELSTRMRLFGVSGWDELYAAVAAQADELTPPARAHTVVITQTYWQAAALDGHAPELPPVYSANRGYAYFGSPSQSATTVLYIGSSGAESILRQTFSDVRVVDRLDSPLGFPGITRHVVLWRCDHPRRPWQEIWPRWRTTVLDSGEGTTR
ncbi:glycosyltransferase family 39 protein [Nocardia sp. NBC_01503]|uniref:ArnT family glycosyltransferase n=1 Tax=Nocardia sp. NBC_01503 TaxID=2975997 RepID=UPI002E7B9878|nr:glycosyltransferase family 39 protein [Nocardia sp. NBC_01503]WTL29723.1 glycosyltransferase family 39 protein [Nocardia sp. NBC_01503]